MRVSTTLCRDVSGIIVFMDRRGSWKKMSRRGMKCWMAKNDLHAMKRILYDMGPWVVSRWPLERVLKLSHSLLVKRPPTPPKNGKKVCLKMLFRQFQVFLTYVFLSGKLADPDPLPPENKKNQVFLKMHFRQYLMFWAYVFLSGKLADPNPILSVNKL